MHANLTTPCFSGETDLHVGGGLCLLHIVVDVHIVVHLHAGTDDVEAHLDEVLACGAVIAGAHVALECTLQEGNELSAVQQVPSRTGWFEEEVGMHIAPAASPADKSPAWLSETACTTPDLKAHVNFDADQLSADDTLQGAC